VSTTAKFKLTRAKAMQTNESKAISNETSEMASYQAPAVESVMTPEEMEREVAYAGDGGPSVVVCSD
jgi:hypothetical protein